MRIVHKDLSKGEIKLKIETLDDMWHLSNIIEEGDMVYATTFRRQQAKQDMLRPTKTEKIKVYLGVRIEKIEFSHHSDTLRLTGIIEEGDQMGSYHTINVETSSTIKIVKKWKDYQLDRILTAVKTSSEPRILIATVDEGECDFGIVKQHGIAFVGSIHRNIPGKRDITKRKGEKENFFREVAEKIEFYLEEREIKDVIVAGPGFVKEEFYSWIKEKRPVLQTKIHIKSTSVTGKTGIWEVVKRGYVESIYKKSRVAFETALVEELFKKILTEEAAYGFEEVKKAVERSQASYVVVTDEMLRKSEEVQDLIELAKNLKSTPHIISTSHEEGEKLRGLGGIGAVLRFKTSYG
ncbi:MAG: mRNA surveillance protein pelota [Candidatus Methanofastidiosia archaeon]